MTERDLGQSFGPLLLIDEITVVRCSTAWESFRKRDKSLGALGPEAEADHHPTPPSSAFTHLKITVV